MTTAADEPLMIDVRSEGEYAAGHMQGSICLPLSDIAARIAQVAPDKQQPIVLCCASGARSEMALRLLQGLGYSQVVNGGGAGQLALRLGRQIQRL